MAERNDSMAGNIIIPHHSHQNVDQQAMLASNKTVFSNESMPKANSDMQPFSEQVISDSAMDQYQNMVNQQAQAAAAIMILGPSAISRNTAGGGVEEVSNNGRQNMVSSWPEKSGEGQPSGSGSRRRCAKEREEKYKCGMCSYRSKWSHALSNHMRKHNNTLFKCTECEYSTTWKGDLTNHMRLHSGNMFECSECDFKTYRKQGLEKHAIKHTGSKPYKCTQCNYSSSQSGNLKKHMMRHTGEKPIACELCSYRCRQTTQLRQHLEQHHGGSLPSSLNNNSTNRSNSKLFRKSFTCMTCRLTWASKAKYTRHMNTKHSVTEMPFKCGFVCHSSFWTQAECLEHRKYHNSAVSERAHCKMVDASTNTDIPLIPDGTLPGLPLPPTPMSAAAQTSTGSVTAQCHSVGGLAHTPLPQNEPSNSAQQTITYKLSTAADGSNTSASHTSLVAVSHLHHYPSQTQTTGNVDNQSTLANDTQSTSYDRSAVVSQDNSEQRPAHYSHPQINQSDNNVNQPMQDFQSVKLGQSFYL